MVTSETQVVNRNYSPKTRAALLVFPVLATNGQALLDNYVYLFFW